MFFGLDTVFLLYGLATSAEAAAVHHHQAQDRPSTIAYHAACTALRRHGIRAGEVPALAVIDFTKPSYLKRLDLYRSQPAPPLRFLCSHGKNSGDIFPFSFSNQKGSHQTSLGLYRVGKSYRGKFGHSLRLHGLDPGLNDRAFDRSVVLHSAWYAGEEIILQNILERFGPRIGRSKGCPAIPLDALEDVTGALPPGSYLYIHGPAHAKPGPWTASLP